MHYVSVAEAAGVELITGDQELRSRLQHPRWVIAPDSWVQRPGNLIEAVALLTGSTCASQPEPAGNLGWSSPARGATVRM